MNLYRALNWVEEKLNKRLTVYVIICIAALIAYCDSFTVPYILDDFGSIQNNYAIHKLFDFADLWKFYSGRIILYFTLSINYFIHDNGVEGYHITNLAIHILNGILLFMIIYHLLGLDYFKGKLIARYRNVVCTVAVLLFICHPIQVNAVTYIVQRTASLAATFYFLAILFFIKYRITDKVPYFVLTMLSIVLAMFTKENTITIPFMLIIIELLFFMKDGRTRWYKRLIFILLLLVTVPIIPLTLVLLKGYSQSDPSVTFKASTSMDRLQYLFTEFNVLVLYIKLMFIPDRQNFDYSNDFPISKTILDNNSYISFLILTFIGLFGLYTIKRNKLVSLGIIWFYVGLAVESSLISIKDVYFEHRLYYPAAGFAMFILGMVFYERKAGKSGQVRFLIRKPLIMLIVVAVIFTTAYTALTIRRNYVYSDSIRLWTDVVDKAPGSDRAHCVLGTSFLNAYDSKKKNTEYLSLAEIEFDKSIDIYYYNSTSHCNLSKVYLLLGEYDKCIEEAKKTLSITKSEYADYNMGSAYEKQGKLKEALDAFLEGYRTNSRSTFILQSLGDIYYKMNDLGNSKKYYEEYLKNSRGSNTFVKNRLKEIDKKTGAKK